VEELLRCTVALPLSTGRTWGQHWSLGPWRFYSDVGQITTRWCVQTSRIPISSSRTSAAASTGSALAAFSGNTARFRPLRKDKQASPEGGSDSSRYVSLTASGTECCASRAGVWTYQTARFWCAMRRYICWVYLEAWYPRHICNLKRNQHYICNKLSRAVSPVTWLKGE
jgi:hypothetical protein